MPIQLQFTLTFQDYLEAQRLHAGRGWLPRLNLALDYTLVPLMGVCFLLFAFLSARGGGAWGPFFVELAVGALLACYPFYLRMRWKRSYLRMRAEQGDYCEVEFSDAMIRIGAANMRSEIEWQALRTFSENRKIFLLYRAPAEFIAIPKRICSEQQIDELRSLFNQEI